MRQMQSSIAILMQSRVNSAPLESILQSSADRAQINDWGVEQKEYKLNTTAKSIQQFVRRTSEQWLQRRYYQSFLCLSMFPPPYSFLPSLCSSLTRKDREVDRRQALTCIRATIYSMRVFFTVFLFANGLKQVIRTTFVLLGQQGALSRYKNSYAAWLSVDLNILNDFCWEKDFWRLFLDQR